MPGVWHNSETSEILAFHPNLVDPAYMKTLTQTSKTWEDVMRIASEPNWLGYVGASALAKASYGATLVDKVSATTITFVT